MASSEIEGKWSIQSEGGGVETTNFTVFWQDLYIDIEQHFLLFACDIMQISRSHKNVFVRYLVRFIYLTMFNEIGIYSLYILS